MKIALWRFYDRMKVANKMASQYRASYGTINATLREPCDVIDPVFTIEVNTTYSGEDTSEETLPYLRANYLSMQWGSEKVRYYYILKKVVLSSSLVELHCHEDVVTTWWDVIKNSTGVIGRCSEITSAESQIPDSLYSATAQTNVSSIQGALQSTTGWTHPSNLQSNYLVTITSGSSNEVGLNASLTYALNQSELLILQYWMLNTDFSDIHISNPISLVSSVIRVPKNFSGQKEQIKIGGKAVGEGIPVLSNITFEVGGIDDISRMFGDFRDYSPYTSAEVLIPLFGFVPIDTEKLFTKSNLTIFATLDTVKGSCVSYLYRGSSRISENLLGVYQNEVGVRYPFLSNNYTESQLQQKAIDASLRNSMALNDINQLSAGIGFVSSLSSIAAAPATGGLSALGGVSGLVDSSLSLARTFANIDYVKETYNNRTLMNSTLSYSSTGISGNASWGLIVSPVLNIYYRNYPSNFPTTVVGRTCFRSATPASITSSSLGTYAEFQSININGSDALFSEVSEIRQIMQSGLYY